MGADHSVAAREKWSFSLIECSSTLPVAPAISFVGKCLNAQDVPLFDYVLNHRHVLASRSGENGALQRLPAKVLALDLSGNETLGASGIRALLHESTPLLAPNITPSSTKLLPSGVVGFGGVATHLVRLDMTACRLCDDGAARIASILFRIPSRSDAYTCRLPSLREMLLDRNEIGDPGCIALCDAIASNLLRSVEQHKQDHQLSAGSASVSISTTRADGTDGLGDSSSYFPLKVLSLRHNYITDASATSLQALIGHSVVLNGHVSLEKPHKYSVDGNTTERGVRWLPQPLSAASKQVRRVAELEVVDLYGNHFGNDGLLTICKSIAQRLTAVTGLSSANDSSCPATMEALDALVANLTIAGTRSVLHDASAFRRLTLRIGCNGIDAQGLSYVISSLTEAHESSVLHHLSTIEQLEHCIARGRNTVGASSSINATSVAAVVDCSPTQLRRRRKSRQADEQVVAAALGGSQRRAALRHISRMLHAATDFSFLNVLDLQGCLLGDDGLLSLIGTIISFSETSGLLGECSTSVVRQVVANAHLTRIHFPHALLVLEELYVGHVGATSFSVDGILALFCCSSEQGEPFDDGSGDFPSPTGNRSISALSPLSAKQKLESRLLRGTSASPARHVTSGTSTGLFSTIRGSASPTRIKNSRRGNPQISGAPFASLHHGCSCALPFLRLVDLSGNHLGRRGGEVLAVLVTHGLCVTAGGSVGSFDCSMQRCQLDDAAISSSLAILRAQLFGEVHAHDRIPAASAGSGLPGRIVLRLQSNRCTHNALVALRDVVNALVDRLPLAESKARTAQRPNERSVKAFVEGNHLVLPRSDAALAASIEWSQLATAPLGAPEFEAEAQGQDTQPSVPHSLPAAPANPPALCPRLDCYVWPANSANSTPRAVSPLPRVSTLRGQQLKASAPETGVPFSAELFCSADMEAAPSVSTAEIEQLLAEAEELLSPATRSQLRPQRRCTQIPSLLHPAATADAGSREPF